MRDRKLIASRPKDLSDADALVRLGTNIDVERVTEALCLIDEALDTDRTGSWLALLAAFKKS